MVTHCPNLLPAKIKLLNIFISVTRPRQFATLSLRLTAMDLRHVGCPNGTDTPAYPKAPVQSVLQKLCS